MSMISTSFCYAWSHSSLSTNACFILLQSAKSGSDHSYNVTNGDIDAGHGASSGKGHGPSDVGNGPSAQSYRRRHEISVTVSVERLLFLKEKLCKVAYYDM